MSETVTLLNVRAVAARIGLSRATVYRMVAAGQFPRPTYPQPGAPRWPSDEVDHWIETLRVARDRAA